MSRPADNSLLFCFVGPGASGKSTVCSELLAESPDLALSISTTTRAPRGAEQEGVHYCYVSEEEFSRRVESGAFLEHAHFAGKRYGTERRNLDDAEKNGRDLLLDIDVQGAVSLKAALGSRVIVVFVFPPSFSVLEERFRARGTETDERIRERLRIAELEIRRLTSEGVTDYLIVNDRLDDAVRAARAIITAERHRFSRVRPETLKALFDRR